MFEGGLDTQSIPIRVTGHPNPGEGVYGMNGRGGFRTGSSGNKAIGPPTSGKSFARASSAESAIGVSGQGGQLVRNVSLGGIQRTTDRLKQAPIAQGPPWLLAYVLLDRKSYTLNECFQLSVRALDRASGTVVHFQDIGNPRIHGEVYQRIQSPKLAEHNELEADIYMQEVSRLGGEWHKRLIETENLTKMLGLDLCDLPCIAFRTSPFTEAVPVRILPTWYASPAACWAFMETLERWLPKCTSSIQSESPPTVIALLDGLRTQLAPVCRGLTISTL